VVKSLGSGPFRKSRKGILGVGCFFCAHAEGENMGESNITFRTIEIDCTRMDSESRTVPASISSEEPVFRAGIGQEVLSHDPSAVDLARAPLPLIESHDQRGLPIGIVEGLRIVGGKLRGVLRFGNSARASEIWKDVKAGILRGISVGYAITDYKPTGDGIRATRWQPLEVSLVSVPADMTVGVGRSLQNQNLRSSEMNTKIKEPAVLPDKTGEQEERRRASDILAMGKQYARYGGERMAAEFVTTGKSVDEFRAALLLKASTEPAETSDPDFNNDAFVRRHGGLSVTRAILAQIDPQKYAGCPEIEASQELARSLSRKPKGLLLPMQTRIISDAGTGSNLVGTQHLDSQFVDVLRKASVLLQMPGITRLEGLVGDVSIPRKTAAASGGWITGDGGDSLTESDPAFDTISLTPKTAGGLTSFSHRMLKQDLPSIDALVQNDLAETLGSILDDAIINGTGASNQPTGILNTTGIGSVAMGTNGAALADLDKIIDLESALTDLNAGLGTLAYMTNSKVAAAMKKLKTTTGEYLWTDKSAGDFPSGTLGAINGYPVARSNHVPSNLSKGTGSNLSAMIFGNWQDFVLASWGAFEIEVDPYSNFAAGSVQVRVLADVDMALRRASSFASIADIIA